MKFYFKTLLFTLLISSHLAGKDRDPALFIKKSDLSPEVFSLQLKPENSVVYIGQPLGLQLAWQSSLDPSSMRALQLNPSFFNNSDIEVAIPRNTAPKEKQIGLPIGGRRVIATREKINGADDSLGSVRLPIYLRFLKPGIYQIPTTQLQVAYLEKPDGAFGRYAAHFNNSFFNPVESGINYERLSAQSQAFTIEVRPLPLEGQHPDFSGLFDPIQIEVKTDLSKAKIGQLIDLTISVNNSGTPESMILLPPLERQAALRGRFLVDPNHKRFWQKDGSQFKVRLRALHTSIQALPSLRIQVFDPVNASYRMLETEPVPIDILPHEGKSTLSIDNFRNTQQTLSDQKAGIGHNLKAHKMTDFYNTIQLAVMDYFWLFLLFGPILYMSLRPWFREQYRKKINPAYALRVATYRKLQKSAPESDAKWKAFLHFMAATFGGNQQAWTSGDSQRAMERIGASHTDRKSLEELHALADRKSFGQSEGYIDCKQLDRIASTIYSLSKKIWILPFVLLFLSHPLPLYANAWEEAEIHFFDALQATQGSRTAEDLYIEAALKFQQSAKDKQHAGKAWYNAGNAWFQAGAIGRAIAAYKNSQYFRPFDRELSKNMEACRALVLNYVPDKRSWLQKIPNFWAKCALLLANTIFWALLLYYTVNRSKKIQYLVNSSGIILLLCLIILLPRQWNQNVQGVLIVDTAMARKGPSYAYAEAFTAPLYDGIEFDLKESRSGWQRIRLHDGRKAWIQNWQLAKITHRSDSK
ncbi:MAG: hypothetical protein ACON39_06725 [Coraliomargaritaceae bacterium]